MNLEDNSCRETYTVQDIAIRLGVSMRTAYNYCKTTEDFRVYKIGRAVRIQKQSFDEWFYKRLG